MEKNGVRNKKRISKKGLIKKLDKIWSETIRQREFCEMCGKPANNPHHVIGRRNLTLRWDLRCGCLLCAYCHTLSKFSAHQDPLGFAEYFKKARPDDYEYLLVRRNIRFDGNYEIKEN